MFNDCEKPAAAKDEECEGKALARRTQAEEKVDTVQIILIKKT